MNIFLIEDNIHLRRTIHYFLLTQGHCVSSYANGKLAFHQAISNIPDLIITDIIMPVMDGYEFLVKLRQTSSTSEIPVIVISGMCSYYQQHTAHQFGASDYIRKPFSKSELQLAVEKQIQRKTIS